MKSNTLTFAPVPILYAGSKRFSDLCSLIKPYGARTLLVTGASSFNSSGHRDDLFDRLEKNGIEFHSCSIAREPSPSMIDSVVRDHAEFKPDSLVAIGGGSALDAGKAISAMLPLQLPVKDYLEGVGTGIMHPGTKLPFIAVPTTSGTGSETTRNAVLSEVGEHGYKRSLRHNLFVSNATILDPELMITCPPFTTASSGMDAFTQLLESFLSTSSNAWTDALALEGLKRVAQSLLRAYREGTDQDARIDMALAAYLSGITLTNVGLGVVHGLAAPAGALRDIPHGVACSALMHASNLVTVRKLRNEGDPSGALQKYARAGRLFTNVDNKPDAYYTDLLVEKIADMLKAMDIPLLASYGLTKVDLAKIAAAGENKNNPCRLSYEELLEVMELSF